MKKQKIPGHKQIVLIYPGITLKLRIIPGQDNLTKICDICFKDTNDMLILWADTLVKIMLCMSLLSSYSLSINYKQVYN